MSWWGESIRAADGSIDRKAIAQRVFCDAGELDRLERLLYPWIAERRKALLLAYQADPNVRAIVFDSPKLYEAGLDKECDAVVFVDAERSVRLARLARSRGWTDAELSRRENLQDPLDCKRANADYVVVNHSDISELRSRVEQVFQSALAAFS